jgi:hypothetical protein
MRIIFLEHQISILQYRTLFMKKNVTVYHARSYVLESLNQMTKKYILKYLGTAK